MGYSEKNELSSYEMSDAELDAVSAAGGEGFDFVQVNGSNTAGDDFSIDPNGQRVRGQGGSDVIVGSVGLNGLI